MADSSDRDQQTQALLELSEARLRAIVDTATDAIVSADTGGAIIHVNRAAERMFGYTSGELVGRPLTVLMPDRFHAAHRAGIARFLATDAPRVIGRTVELSGLRKNGDEFPVELSLAACRTTAHSIFTGILRDITWRRRTERELAQKHGELEAANSELEAFSYSVSHDLRNPLRSIQGFSQVLLEDCRDQLNDDGRDALDRICAATERMEQLIDALLALSRVTRKELHHDVVDLSAIAHGVFTDLQAHEPTRDVAWVIEPDLTACGDARLLRVVVENLLGNAWKATARRAHGRIEFRAADEGGRRVFCVQDNGLGFDPRYARKLFRPLQLLHRRAEFPGTGIGLATVQRIVMRHGGTVWAVGEPDKGAAFYFAF